MWWILSNNIYQIFNEHFFLVFLIWNKNELCFLLLRNKKNKNHTFILADCFYYWMGNSCSASCPLNICLNAPRTSSQAEDEILQAKSMNECAIIDARERQTASVNNQRFFWFVFERRISIYLDDFFAWTWRCWVRQLRGKMRFFCIHLISRGSWLETFVIHRIAKLLPYVKFIFPTA